MRIASFVFGVMAGMTAAAFALVAVGQVVFSEIEAKSGAGGANASMERFVRDRTFYQWSALSSGFGTLSGLCFVASAIFRHAEQSSGSSGGRSGTPGM